jgi:hypothetical protein
MKWTEMKGADEGHKQEPKKINRARMAEMENQQSEEWQARMNRDKVGQRRTEPGHTRMKSLTE